MKTEPTTQSYTAVMLVCLTVLVCLLGAGCSKQRSVDAALETDANGYVCRDCSAKFYTERTVFATCCPECKKKNLDQAIAYYCPADKQLSAEGRSKKSTKCRQCGATVTELTLPKTVDLEAWGAKLRTAAEVGG